MADPAHTTAIVNVLSSAQSPLRAELITLAIDALLAHELSPLLSDPALTQWLHDALSEDNVQRLADRHVLPGAERVLDRLHETSEKLHDALHEGAEAEIAALVEHARGPTLGWLRGAIEPADLRELLGPVVQEVLLQFTTKLPLAGLGGHGPAGGAAGLGGLVGMLGKQVQKSARELADVGRSVIGGLGSELERRMQTMARDFSHTAMTEFRRAFVERLSSDEGRVIVARMRGRIVTHVLQTNVQVLASDLALAPRKELARVAARAAPHLREQALFQDLVQRELAALLDAIGKQSARELLREAGLLDTTRAMLARVAEPAAAELFGSSAFADWLGRLLDQSGVP